MLKFQKFFSLFLLSVAFYAYSQENIYAAPGQSTTVGERKVLQEDIPIKLTCAPGEEIKRVAIQLGDGITGITSFFPILWYAVK